MFTSLNLRALATCYAMRDGATLVVNLTRNLPSVIFEGQTIVAPPTFFLIILFGV